MEENWGAKGELLFQAFVRSGRGRVSRHRRKRVLLTLIASEDDVILAQQGLAALRQTRILRLCRQASDQGTILTYDDLVHLLSTSVSTLKRDVSVLQRQGVTVTLYKQRGRRPIGPLLLLILICLPTRTVAQLSSIFGGTELGYQFQQRRSEEDSTSAHTFLHRSNLGLNGRILHPRLAAFSLTGTFGGSHFGRDDVQLYSYGGNLTLLSGAPYTLGIRHFQSFAMNNIDIDRIETDVDFRLTLPRFPRLSLTLDQEKVTTRGDAPSEVTTSSAKLRLSKQTRRTTTDVELGIQKREEAIARTTNHHYFGRFTNTIALNPKTSLRTTSDANVDDDLTTVISSASLINQPGPNFTRTLELRHQYREFSTIQTHTVEAIGSLFKSFTPFPWLNVGTTASLSARGDTDDGFPIFSGRGGSNIVMSYFRPVLVNTGYTVNLTYEKDEPVERIHQARLGLVSQTLSPLRLSGDYFLVVQNGNTDSNSHLIIARADIQPAKGLFLGAVAEYQKAKFRFVGPPIVSFEQESKSFGIDTSYAYNPRFNIALNFGSGFRWTQTLTSETITAHSNAGLQYVFRFPGRPTLGITGTTTYTTLYDDLDYEIAGLLRMTIGQMNLEAQVRIINGRLAQSNLISLRLSRAFRKDF